MFSVKNSFANNTIYQESTKACGNKTVLFYNLEQQNLKIKSDKKT